MRPSKRTEQTTCPCEALSTGRERGRVTVRTQHVRQNSAIVVILRRGGHMFGSSRKTVSGPRGEELPEPNEGLPDSSTPSGLCPRCGKQSSFDVIGSLPVTFDLTMFAMRPDGAKEPLVSDRVSSLICRHCHQGGRRRRRGTDWWHATSRGWAQWCSITKGFPLVAAPRGEAVARRAAGNRQRVRGGGNSTGCELPQSICGDGQKDARSYYD